MRQCSLCFSLMLFLPLNYKTFLHNIIFYSVFIEKRIAGDEVVVFCFHMAKYETCRAMMSCHETMMGCRCPIMYCRVPELDFHRAITGCHEAMMGCHEAIKGFCMVDKDCRVLSACFYSFVPNLFLDLKHAFEAGNYKRLATVCCKVFLLTT